MKALSASRAGLLKLVRKTVASPGRQHLYCCSMQAQRRLPARNSTDVDLDLEEEGGPPFNNVALLPLVQQAGSYAAGHWQALALLLGLGLAATLLFSHMSGSSAWWQQSLEGASGQQPTAGGPIANSLGTASAGGLTSSGPAGGLQLKPGSPRGPSRASAQEVQALLANIDRELEPWTEGGISLEGIERAYCSLGPYEKENFRLQVGPLHGWPLLLAMRLINRAHRSSMGLLMSWAMLAAFRHGLARSGSRSWTSCSCTTSRT